MFCVRKLYARRRKYCCFTPEKDKDLAIMALSGAIRPYHYEEPATKNEEIFKGAICRFLLKNIFKIEFLFVHL